MRMNDIRTVIALSFTVVLFTACNNKPSGVIEGRIKRETISVSGKVAGRIEKIFVEEGDNVKAGDTLALLHLPEVDAKMAQAEGAVKSADAQYEMAKNGATALQLQQLNAKYEGLKDQYQFARTSVGRLANMLKDSLIAQQQYDEAYTRMQGAKAQLDAVTAQIKEAKDGARAEQQTMAMGQKDRAAGALKEAGAASVERYVIAPQDMSIESITLHKGELALPGYALFTGYLNTTTYFRFSVPESAIAKVKKKQRYTVHIPYNKTDIEGEVTSVSQLNHYADITTAYPDFEMGEALYEVKIRPVNPAQTNTLLANATATLELSKK